MKRSLIIRSILIILSMLPLSLTQYIEISNAYDKVLTYLFEDFQIAFRETFLSILKETKFEDLTIETVSITNIETIATDAKVDDSYGISRRISISSRQIKYPFCLISTIKSMMNKSKQEN